MVITVNVNVNAPLLSTAIISLAAAMSGKPLDTATLPVAAEETAKESKSNFSFPLKDAAVNDKPDENAAPAEDPKPEPDKKPEAPKEDPEKPKVTLEQVRAKLSALAQAGKQTEVKKLLTDLGAAKLTDVPAEKYGELLAAAEGIA